MCLRGALESSLNQILSYGTNPPMKPNEDEKICLVSYKVASILLNGDPESRPSFWKAYRRELKLNQETDYENYHLKVCQHYWSPKDLEVEAYYRKGSLRIQNEQGENLD